MHPRFCRPPVLCVPRDLAVFHLMAGRASVFTQRPDRHTEDSWYWGCRRVLGQQDAFISDLTGLGFICASLLMKCSAARSCASSGDKTLHISSHTGSPQGRLPTAQIGRPRLPVGLPLAQVTLGGGVGIRTRPRVAESVFFVTFVQACGSVPANKKATRATHVTQTS